MKLKNQGKHPYHQATALCITLLLIISLLMPQSAIALAAKKAAVVPAKKVTIQLSKKYFEVGDSFTAKAVFTPEDTTYRSMTWSVEGGGSVQKVSDNKFKAVSMGTATIVGYQKDTKKKYKKVIEVYSPLPEFDIMNGRDAKISSVTIYPNSKQIVNAKYRTKYYLNEDAYAFTYSVKDKKVATVSSLGVLTGKKEGTTTLVVTGPNGAKKELKVNVKKEPKGLWTDSFYLTESTDILNSGGYNYRSSYDDNYASSDGTYLFPTADGNLVLYNYVNKDYALSYEVFDKNYKRTKQKKIDFPYDLGGVYLAEDGNTYVVGGSTNTKESNTAIVFVVIKYDKNMKEIGRSNITGEECNTTVPFDAGGCSIAMQGDTLIIHTARERYTSSDGLNHQSNITIVIDAKTMEKRYVGQLFPYNHVSHSFNQFVRFDGNNIVYVDHGDAYPRSVVMQIHEDGVLAMAEKNPGLYWWPGEINLLDIVGKIGDNHTGTRVGGFETGKYNNVVAGVSLPHDSITSDELFYYYSKNVYVALASKDGEDTKLLWLTDFKEGSGKSAMNLRMVKLGEDRFGLIYQIDENNPEEKYEMDMTTKLAFILIDSKGSVLARKEWDGQFGGYMQPVFYQGDIIWLSGSVDLGRYSNTSCEYNSVERIHLGGLIK